MFDLALPGGGGERDFSVASMYITKQRSWLQAKMVEMLLVVSRNMKLVYLPEIDKIEEKDIPKMLPNIPEFDYKAITPDLPFDNDLYSEMDDDFSDDDSDEDYDEDSDEEFDDSDDDNHEENFERSNNKRKRKGDNMFNPFKR